MLVDKHEAVWLSKLEDILGDKGLARTVLNVIGVAIPQILIENGELGIPYFGSVDLAVEYYDKSKTLKRTKDLVVLNLHSYPTVNSASTLRNTIDTLMADRHTELPDPLAPKHLEKLKELLSIGPNKRKSRRKPHSKSRAGKESNDTI